MPRTNFRRRSATCATLLAVGATTVFGGAGVANASHSATNSLLTASDGTAYITMNNGVRLQAEGYTVTDAAWSPDGSRAVFVTDDGDIATIRWNDGSSIYSIANPDPGSQRANPEWVGNGSSVVWAAKSAGSPWRIEQSVSAYGSDITTRSPNDGRHYLDPDTGDGQRIVVQRQADDGNGNPTGTPEIGFLDGSTWTRITTDAASPTLSPDGKRVAFVRSGQIWSSDLTGGDLVQVTYTAGERDDPAWSPDGGIIAFRQGSQVAWAAADGSWTGVPNVVSGLSGMPECQPRNQNRVVRLSGADRYGTTSAISQSHWASANSTTDQRARAQAVVLSRSDTFADALGGSALAAAKQGPLLMTPPTALQPAIATEMRRVLAPGGTVYLLGSAGALSTTVEQQVKALGFTTVRIAGADRFGTSVAIANAVDPAPDMVLAATGMNFPDALAAGAAAGAQNLPGKGSSAVVVLTNDDKLPPATKTYLDGLSADSAVVGVGLQGATATEPYGAIPLYGDSRFETALLTAWAFFGGENHVGVATGMNWPDALAGGALMASLDGPLILAPGTADSLGPEVEELATEFSGSLHTGLVFGSAAVVNDVQADGLGRFLSGPAGYVATANATDVGLPTAGTTAQRTTAAPAPELRTAADVADAAKAAQRRLAE
ncbi:cell wall-binding repeat-containing protein [Micromonospora inositola]|uniref:WD40-like Beta Propeller Repeat n=1 Tax=Micromonospora inositola TaxID=47865 RepID=A0A1C5HT23_9ACTN|nr:cell wall-binding repeat-containing protein [Micromonospora inositola]SCG49159.1 WD40-like Beta Propeller Repeat [Micromonospora inositola]